MEITTTHDETSRVSLGKRDAPYRGSSPRKTPTSPLRPLSYDNTPSPTDSTPRSFAFPPSSQSHPVNRQRSSLVIRQRRSSPLLHEIQGPSRRLSAHQMLLLTPFGTMPMEALSGPGPGAGMTRLSSDMGGPNQTQVRAGSMGMSSNQSSMGMGRDDGQRPLPSLSSRFNARHQSLGQSMYPSPLSQPLATIQSTSDYGSESDSSSLAISREPSNSSATDADEEEEEDSDRRSIARSINHVVVDMMRSNSLPVLTQRELDAMQDKDGELGIARGSHWAWVSQEDNSPAEQPNTPLSRPTPPARPFAFQDPFASNLAAGPSSRYQNPTSTSSEYHYSPNSEPRRMSEVNPTWPHNTSPGSHSMNQSRGTSVATITLSSSMNTMALGNTNSPQSSSPGSSSYKDHLSHIPASAFNARASMSALDQEPLVPSTIIDNLSAPMRPRMLRYKTSPARFTGLGLHLVVKPQDRSGSGSGSGSGSSGPSTATASRRRSSQRSLDQDRRRSSGTNSTSSTESRRGTWTVVDVVETLSSTAQPELSLPSTSTSSSYNSLRSDQLPARTSISTATANSNTNTNNPVYTVEHISSRSWTADDRFRSLPTRKGKLRARNSSGIPSGSASGFTFASDQMTPMTYGDPLAFPRRGSLAVLSQTPLGPWAATNAGEELLGAPKGNWQDRRGSWAEGWSNSSTKP